MFVIFSGTTDYWAIDNFLLMNSTEYKELTMFTFVQTKTLEYLSGATRKACVIAIVDKLLFIYNYGVNKWHMSGMS